MRMANRKSAAWQGISYLAGGIAILGWEWIRNRDAALRGHGEVFAIILAPAFCLVGLRMLLADKSRDPIHGLDAWTTPLMLFGVVLGIANAYLLGVWRLVTRDTLIDFAPLLVIAGLVAGIMIVRDRRAKAQADL